MKDTPLDRSEQALLAVICEMDAEGGAVERDALSVRARGRGLEVARPLSGLVARGLIEEIQRRPLLLARVFGARQRLVLKLTDAGRAAGTGVEADETEAVPEAVPVAVEPVAVEAVAPEPVAVEPPVVPEPAAEPPEPEVPEPDAPADEPAAETAAPAEAPKAPPPRAPRPDRKTVKAFTDELGGAPVSQGGVSLSHGVEPEVMDGIRDVLAGFGMELTFAGEALVGARVSAGATAGDALCEVVLFAFAHAVREDVASGGALVALGLGDYAAEMAGELRKLHAAGLIGADRIEADLARLVALTEDGPAREALAAGILSDPVGGLLPTALLPEELRPAGEA
ncbi:hypothetical protein [Rhodovulum strictum]|uniref:Uncharacterized protein n=1 Tax=Rhodovulum strictum TaxID=58314 RepID=A0A844B8J1_9RHOB|nr:hypothetical protein [Rhodovulum strictum]MRH20734.1 hypothetical protein [Rhodovulum strictum]